MRVQASDNPTAQDRIVAYLIADDAPAVDWLREMGLEAANEDGAWKLTAPGEVAMARFHGLVHQPGPARRL